MTCRRSSSIFPQISQLVVSIILPPSMVLLLFKSCWSGTSAVPALNCIPCSQTRRPGPSWLETSSSAFTSNSKSLQALPYNLLQFSWFTFYKESKSVQSKYYINFFSLINIAVCGNIGILVIELSVRVWCEARHGYLLAVTLNSMCISNIQTDEIIMFLLLNST